MILLLIVIGYALKQTKKKFCGHILPSGALGKTEILSFLPSVALGKTANRTKLVLIL